MDNQHQKIKGYRDLSAAEIALMNEVKAMGESLDGMLTNIANHLASQANAARGDTVECNRIGAAEPMRWLSMARTDLQVGIMKAVRAIAQPGSF